MAEDKWASIAAARDMPEVIARFGPGKWERLFTGSAYCLNSCRDLYERGAKEIILYPTPSDERRGEQPKSWFRGCRKYVAALTYDGGGQCIFELLHDGECRCQADQDEFGSW